MKKNKRVLSFLLAVMMILAALPISAFAATIDISVDQPEPIQVRVGEQKDITITSSYSNPINWRVVSTTRGTASISPTKTVNSDGYHSTTLSVRSGIVGRGKVYITATDSSNRRIYSKKYVYIEFVESLNQAPVFDGSFTITTDEDVPAGIDVTATDPDGDALTYTYSQPFNGTVSKTADTTYLYTPNQDFNGTDSFRVTASDGIDSTTVTVDITVNPVNDAPVAVDDTASGKVGKTLRINVLENDYDVDSDPLSIHSFTPAAGADIIKGDGYFDVTAANPDVYTFTYCVSDGTLISNSATVTVTFTEDPDYFVTVNNGTAIPTVAKEGDPVTITAKDAESGEQFKNWTVNSGNVILANASAAETSFTMPAGNVTVTANFETIPTTITYLALGDSIPYGYYYRSLWDYLRGGTDSYSYIEQLRDALGILPGDYYDRSVSGNNAIDVLNQLSDPDVVNLISNADVITLCVGGNDIMDAVPRRITGLDKTRVNWTQADQGRADFEAYWYRIIDGIEEINPDVTLIVMTVYNPYRLTDTYFARVDSYFEGNTAGSYGLNYIIRHTETLYDDLLLDDFDYRVVDIYNAFNTHSNKDSLTGFYSSFCDPHPNQAGQNLIFTEHYGIYN